MKSLRYLFRIGNGPSSSHTIAPLNAIRFIVNENSNAKKMEVILRGSLAFTGRGHFTDVAINSELDSHKIQNSISFDYDTETEFPNEMEVIVDGNKKYRVISLGGGALKINDKLLDDNTEVYPEKNFSEIKEYCLSHNISLPEYVYLREGNDIKEYLKKVFETMMDTVNRGLEKGGVLPGKLHLERKANIFFEKDDENESNQSRMTRLVTSYAYACGEENASGGVVVTAPTCGSCGVLPAVLRYYSDSNDLSLDSCIDALAVAGIIGNVIKHNGSISGAEAGCQAEIGTATAMSAAAMSFLRGLNINGIESASEMAIEHSLGLTCDPVLGYVQIPCIERNAVAALEAIQISYISDFVMNSHLVSLDDIINTALMTGKDLKSNYRETSSGGLATITKFNAGE